MTNSEALKNFIIQLYHLITRTNIYCIAQKKNFDEWGTHETFTN